MRCDQCRHWKPLNDWDFTAYEMRRCGAIKQAWNVKDEPFEGEGVKSRHDYDDWDQVERMEADAMKSAKAVAQDGSSYAASVLTAADFGCVLFEAKP